MKPWRAIATWLEQRKRAPKTETRILQYLSTTYPSWTYGLWIIGNVAPGKPRAMAIASLRRLLDAGLVEAEYREEVAPGARRRYYRITKSGRAQLAKTTSEIK